MHTLVKHPLVDCDLEEAALWYHQRDPSVAMRLIDEARIAMLAAAEKPLLFSIRFEEVRRVELRGFPHSVYFKIRGETVCVLALLHGAREVEKLIQARNKGV